MSRAILLVLALAGCTTQVARQPEVPRIRCLNIGHIPDSAYWLYACEFRGDSVPPVLDDPGFALGGS